MASQSSLNHMYRTVWNEALGAMVAVAENASSNPGSGASAARSSTQRKSASAAWPLLGQLSVAIALGWGLVPLAQANPSGGVAVQGQATMATNGNTLTVTTQNAPGTNFSAINWQSFSVAPGETTRINQPNAGSMSINRVVTNTPSVLLGTLSSNGKVVLVNQSGIAVGAGAQVDTAGFTASVLGMTDQDAAAGRLRFGGASVGSPSGALTVQGNIIARGGDVVLIAPSVELARSAVVEAQGGDVVLAAGQSVEITGRGLEGITLQVQAPTDQAVNLGTLKGDAVGIFASTLRHSGVIQATQAAVEGGRVVLKASGDAYVEGDAKIQAISSNGKGGSVSVLGNRVAVTDNAQIDASGASGGGTVLVGGDYQGKNAAVQNASVSYVGQNTRIQADATDNGNGGKVIVWADDTTRAYGSVSARGGATGGNGGMVEVSGHRYLDFQGKVDTRAPAGATGILLLDPSDITINASGPDVNIAGLGSGTLTSSPTVNSTMTWGTIDAQLGLSSLIIQTDVASTSGVGNINITSSGTLTHANLLTLKAHNNLNLGAGVAVTGLGDVNLVAGWNSSGLAVNSGNGVINFATGSSLSTPGQVYMNAGSAVTAADTTPYVHATTLTIGNTAGGSLPGGVYLPGPNLVNTLAVQADAGSGSVTFHNNQALTIGSGLYFSGIVAGPNTSPVAITSSGDLTVAQPITTGGNLSLISATGGINLGSNVNASGTLSMTANTNINQSSGNVVVTGVTTASSSAGDVVMMSGGNDFSTVNLTGGSVQVRDTNAMAIGSLSSGANKKVVLVAGGNLTLPASAINTGTADLQIGSGGTLTQQNDLAGNNVKLVGTMGVSVQYNVTASGTLDIAASNGSVVQGGSFPTSIVVAGVTTVNAGSGGVSLGSSTNNFSTLAVSAVGGDVSVSDTNALVLNAVSGPNVTINAGGALSQSAGIISTGGILNTTSVGGTTLNNTNAVNTFTATNTGSGGVSLVNSGALTLQGITNSPATGTVRVQNTGNLSLSGNISSGAPGDAVVLATTGNFNDGGSSITFTGAGSPRWLIYSVGPSSNSVLTLGPLAQFQQYGITYPSAPAQTTGNGLLYSGTSSPVPVTILGPISKVYDGSAIANLTTSNYAPGSVSDPVFGASSSVVVTAPGLGVYDTPNAGTGKAVTSSGGTAQISFGGRTVYGYQLASGSVNFGVITPAPLTLTTVSGSLVGTTSKVYDGSTFATLTPANFLLTGFVGTDSATVTKTTGAYASKDAGSGIAVSTSLLPSDYSAVGTTNLSNYALPKEVSGNIGVITPKQLTLATTVANKVFDGTTAATVTGYGLSGFVAGETVGATSTSANFDTQDIGNGKTVTVGGINLVDGSGGGLARNYTVASSTTAMANIVAPGTAVTNPPPVNSTPPSNNSPGSGPTSTPTDFVATFLEKFQVAVLNQEQKKDDKAKVKSDLVLEGDICRP